MSDFDVTGFDCQISGSNSFGFFVDSLARACRRNSSSYDQAVLEMLKKQLAILESGKGLRSDFSETGLANLSSLEEHLRGANGMSLLRQTLLGFTGHFSDLYHNKLIEKLGAGKYDFADNNVRDSLMAVQLLYLHKIKIIDCGANAHFANQIQKIPVKLIYSNFNAGKVIVEFILLGKK